MARARAATTFEPSAAMRVLLLHGQEAFLMRERTRAIVDVLTAAFGTIERFEYDGAAADLASVLDELRSYGLMCPHKLVVLDRADEFLSGDEGRRRALENYVRAPVDHATLLLRAPTWRPGNLDKLIAAAGLVHKLEAVDAATAARWCGARCQKRYETAIGPEAAAALVDQIGTDLERLDGELAKLASYVGGERAISVSDVAELVGQSREEQAWAIQSAIASGDVGAAVHTLRHLLTVSRHPEQLVTWAVSDLLRKLHAASRRLAQGAPAAAVARELRLWGPERDEILRIAGAISPAHLAQLLRAAIESDWRTKRGVGEGQRSLEVLTVLVTDSMRPTPRRP